MPSPALLSVAANAEGLLESRSIRPFSIEGISGAEAVDWIEEPMIEGPQHGLSSTATTPRTIDQLSRFGPGERHCRAIAPRRDVQLFQ
ncbi:hypothetical protein GG804_22160 [Sphingomonas histidinilytica]|uniref:hypothetical protein n=1 Tax=Rhizorhabdus histidinilytica TaxID=439228 RepID=UPI001ADBEC78|nr:hypothetical protein [Rhizorhabdus histidinilytica]MBO9379480.1 hypothetical protein [Rhizorhabdus histidinilytica]